VELVHTGKNSKNRLIAYYFAQKTGKSKEEVERLPRGCSTEHQRMRSKEPMCRSIRSDSLTASLLAFAPLNESEKTDFREVWGGSQDRRDLT